MAKALLVVERVGGGCAFRPCVDTLKYRLTPDNIVPRTPLVKQRDGVNLAVFNASSAARIRDGGICLGTLFSGEADWHRPGAPKPEGCYAIMRSDAGQVELVADAAATRTIWYASTPDIFVASTSQRAILTVLGSFEPNVAAVSWMLSTGTLGPERGWDRRLRQVLPGERVVLDRARWEVTHDEAPIQFEPAPQYDEAHHAQRLADALEEIRNLKVDPEKWVYLLSGGIDSRGLLALIASHQKIRTVTWGMRDSSQQPFNDASVAQRVADAFGVEHRFLPTDPTDEPRELLIRRYLVAGEGRIANISPFTDGFSVWKTLHDDGVECVIRGDEAFGSRFVDNPYVVRHTTKLTLLTDYLTPEEIDSLELPEQALPARLDRFPAETLAMWRDRLYQQNRLPKFLAAISDLQASYVEVTNPLLASRILQTVRTLPDWLRTDKQLWRKLARRDGMRLRPARRVAVMPLQRFVSDTHMLEVMLDEMELRRSGDLLSPPLRRYVCTTLRKALSMPVADRAPMKPPGLLALLAPEYVRDKVRQFRPLRPQFEPLVFAFRAFIVSRMSATLKEDSLTFAASARQYAANS